MRPRSPYAATLAVLLALVAPSAACSAPADPPGRIAPRTADRGAAPVVTKVLAISVDGFNPTALKKLGRKRTPNLHRLLRQGASTLNARTEREMTVTLPNHTGMVTGRRIDADHGGHGVTWNDDRLKPRTVHDAAGHDVASVFRVVDSDERDPALFAAKQKFTLFKRSWPAAVDKIVIRKDNHVLTKKVRRDLVRHRRAFTFLHLSKPDLVGHAKGFMSEPYLRAVADVDRMIGQLLGAIDGHQALRNHLVVVLTADHGGKGGGHSDPRKLTSYRVPFVIWGPTVAKGADLYDLNPDYADPGKKRTRYSAARQPVRNGDLANVVTDLLGLPAVPGSEHDAGQDLDWN